MAVETVRVLIDALHLANRHQVRKGQRCVLERQVFALVAAGLLNKQIADRIAITEATVKLHRSQVMKKMEAQSLPELVRMADSIAKAGADLPL